MTTEFTQAELVGFADNVRLHYYSVATSEDLSISGQWAPSYQRAQAMFKAALGVAFPDLDPDELFEVYLDCMEPVEHLAQVVRERKADPEYAGWTISIRYADGFNATGRTDQLYTIQEEIFKITEEYFQRHGEIKSIHVA